ncbi:MAG: RluA family pseudouridine synthase [Flavobacteriaceae bacterium]
MKNTDNNIEDLHEHYSFNVDLGQEPLRVDKYLLNKIENTTRTKIQFGIKNGSVYVNRNKVKTNYKVKGGDQIKVLFNHPPHENLLVPEKIPLNIIYEDETIIVINKDPGLVVHPGHGNYSGTLVNGLLYHLEKLPKNNFRPGLVHRIDKDTSGLIVVAKTESSMANLSNQFLMKTTKREYNALVWGDVIQDNGSINGNIIRNPKNRLQMSVSKDIKKGKKAITNYNVIERFGYVTLLSCKLETGRTHQIRVHLKHIGHNLFNDERYGGNLILKGTTFSNYKKFVQNCFKILPRQALHAKVLGFNHPKSNKWIEFDSELPDDMEGAIGKWRNYSKHKIL